MSFTTGSSAVARISDELQFMDPAQSVEVTVQRGHHHRVRGDVVIADRASYPRLRLDVTALSVSTYQPSWFHRGRTTVYRGPAGDVLRRLVSEYRLRLPDLPDGHANAAKPRCSEASGIT